jgi:hypothetical protein
MFVADENLAHGATDLVDRGSELNVIADPVERDFHLMKVAGSE